jgi:SAM-dependent methyltransferase
MAKKDREKWDARYSKDLGGTEPSTIIIDYCPLASVGNALDIACGNGRNSIFLAESGFYVDAVDISPVATSQLAGKHVNVNAICTDLDTWAVPPNRYELIINIRFLDRRLFPMIQDGLRPGGVLIFESFLDGIKDVYCLKQNELLRAFPSLRVVYYEEKKIDPSEKFDQVASLVAIKPGGVTERSPIPPA